MITINDKTAYRMFHDIDFNKYPCKLLRQIKTKFYPITSLFIVETDYAKFYLDDMVKVTNIDEYCLDDLRPDDIVLDIGACIGAFSLKVHDKVKKVWAFEPVLADRMIRNVKLNRAENIEVCDFGLGDGLTSVVWAGYKRKAITVTLTRMVNAIHPTFLKLDAEGAEWCIKPEELKGIRRIEAEIHRTNEHECSEFLTTLHEAGYKYSARYTDTEDLMIVHARRKD